MSKALPTDLERIRDYSIQLKEFHCKLNERVNRFIEALAGDPKTFDLPKMTRDLYWSIDSIHSVVDNIKCLAIKEIGKVKGQKLKS